MTNQLKNPKFILDTIANYIQEGDISTSTDLISAYITDREDFAVAIGTTVESLHRMLAHDGESLNVFFKAIEKIHQDYTNSSMESKYTDSSNKNEHKLFEYPQKQDEDASHPLMGYTDVEVEKIIFNIRQSFPGYDFYEFRLKEKSFGHGAYNTWYELWGIKGLK
jgi:hypothetical protein